MTGLQAARADLAPLPGHDGLIRLFDLLPDARLIGGSVRDLLCGHVPSDLDLATPEPPERVQALLEAASIKVVPTGLSHGTVTAVIDARPFEITTLRRDDETDGRHAVVSWTSDWREDAARRDFTINAMSCGRDGRIHDYFGGLADLEARRVRFVGDPGLRIEEDALRILRFFRFTARFGGDVIDGPALAAITARAALIDKLSRERVASEFLRLLGGPRVIAMLRAMAEGGVLPHVIATTDARIAQLETLIVRGLPADPILRLVVIATDAVGAARALRLSNAQVARLEAATSATVGRPAPEWDDDALRRARSLDSACTLTDRTWLAQAENETCGDWNALRARIEAIDQPVYPLTGRDAASVGLKPGPAMGQALRSVEAWWRAGGCRADRAACLARLREIATS